MIGPGWWSYLHQDEQAAQQSIDRSVLRRVAAYGRPYVGRIALMLLTILAITGLTLVPPLLMRALIDEALPNRDLGQLNLLAAGMVLVPLVNGLVGVFQRYVSSQIGEGIIFDLRRAVFDHLQRLSMPFYDRSKAGVLVSRMTSDVDSLSELVQMGLTMFVSNALLLVISLVVLTSVSWQLMLVCAIALPPVILASIKFQRDSNTAWSRGSRRISSDWGRSFGSRPGTVARQNTTLSWSSRAISVWMPLAASCRTWHCRAGQAATGPMSCPGPLGSMPLPEPVCRTPSAAPPICLKNCA